MSPSTHAHLSSDYTKRGALYGLLAAALFGSSAPLAKILLGSLSPVLLAGLLYLGAATGLWIYRIVAPPPIESPLGKNDLGPLAIVVLCGGLLGPVLMLLGLQRCSAMIGSLLLNLEAPLTIAIAVLFFKEHLGRSAFAAAVCIFSGALLLNLQTGNIRVTTSGVVLLTAACACWAIDNNFTQRLSLKDPFAIVRVKTLVAGLCNTVIGITLARAQLPSAKILVAAMVLGSLSYGVSVVLDVYALRYIGAAREAALFATAPFLGALLSWLIFHDPVQLREVGAMGCMVAGVVFLLRQRHNHKHVHSPVTHEHLHSHDAHHQHLHAGDVVLSGDAESHSHSHEHVAIAHEHPHASDVHHRHEH